MKENRKLIKKREKNMLKRNKGITLIALVITIIILLILAGVSIAMLTGNNGILTQAQNAKEETEKASLIEQVKVDILEKQSENNSVEITAGILKEILDEYFERVPEIDEITEEWIQTAELTTNEKYGEYEIKLSEIYNGQLKEINIPKGLEIGSTVYYSSSGEYKWQAKYCSSPENTIYEKNMKSSTDEEFNINSWKVLEIDYLTGNVTLVPEHQTNGSVYLCGIQGYNNAVKLLNDACNELYGDESKGIKARSINLEDIELKMTKIALEEAHTFINDDSNTKYGDKISDAYAKETNRFYPAIYSQENKSVVDERENSNGLERNEQNQLVEADGNEILQAKTSIQPYQTTWYKENSFMQTAFETASNGVNYYSLLIPDGVNTFYWLASRAINNYSNRSDFNVNRVNKGDVGNYLMVNSGKGIMEATCNSLFPIISLNSELISIDTNGISSYIIK